MDDSNAANKNLTKANTEGGLKNEIKETLDEVTTKIKNTHKVNSEKKYEGDGNAKMDARNQTTAEEFTIEHNVKKYLDENKYCEIQNIDFDNSKEENVSRESDVEERIPSEVSEQEGDPSDANTQEGHPTDSSAEEGTPAKASTEEVGARTKARTEEVGAPTKVSTEEIGAPSKASAEEGAAPAELNADEGADPAKLNTEEGVAPPELNAEEGAAPPELNAEEGAAPAELNAEEGAASAKCKRRYLVDESIYHENITMEEIKRRQKKAFYFAHNLCLYAKRIFNKLKGGRSDKKEGNIHLYEYFLSEFQYECSYEYYISNTNLAEYRHIAGLENRDETLFSTFKRKFESLGDSFESNEFMGTCASCIYVALELEEYESFEGASQCAFCAVASAFCYGELVLIFECTLNIEEVPDCTLDRFFINRRILLEHALTMVDGFPHISTHVVFLN